MIHRRPLPRWLTWTTVILAAVLATHGLAVLLERLR
jgi:hypothetical protein